MKIIFLHIPKTAGTSFNQILASEYGKKNVQFRKVIALEQETELIIDDFKNTNVFAGHYSYGIHNNINSDFRYIMFVRNPVSRIVSHYNYVSRTQVHNLSKVIESRNLSLKDYALSNLTIELDNGMLRQITGTKLPINELRYDLLQEAKDIIQHNFEVGITEKFDESIILFKDNLKWQKSNLYYKLKVTSKNNQIQVDEETIRLIKERNYLDIELYDWCVSLFTKRISEIPNFSKKLKRFKFYNRIYIGLYAKPYTSIKALAKRITNS